MVTSANTMWTSKSDTNRGAERFSPHSWFEGRQRRTRHDPPAGSFDAADVPGEPARRAVSFLGEHFAVARRNEPFFLCPPFASPHTPGLPTGEWRGKSGLNAWSDFTRTPGGWSALRPDGAAAADLPQVQLYDLYDLEPIRAYETISMRNIRSGCGR